MAGRPPELRQRARQFVDWAPSPWMMLVLSVWWAWRWAALPPRLEQAGLPVIAGFAHDALVLYGLFGGLRWLQQRGGTALVWPIRVLFAFSAVARGLDALQVHISGTRITAGLLRILVADPIGELWGLRGLLAAVAASTALAVWALHRDRRLWSRLRRRGAGKTGFRLDVVSGAALIAGLALAIGRGTDPASSAPEIVCLSAFAEFLGG